MSSPELVIRSATSSDLAQIVACVEAAYVAYVGEMGKKPAPMLDDYPSLVDRGVVTVASSGGALVGLIVMWPRDKQLGSERQPDSDGHFYVDNLAVEPAAQGCGVGAALLGEADRAARAAGCDEIRLYTNESMTANLDYYPRRGFVESHRAIDAGYRRVYFVRPVPQSGPSDPS